MLRIRRDEDQLILERIRNNDRTVLGEVFIKYRRLIYSYIQSHGGNERDAEDILQEVVIVVWQKASNDQLNLTAKLGTYMLAIAKNKWMAQSRKVRKLVNQEIPEEVIDGNPDSLQQVIGSEQREWVRQALGGISSLCKRLLLLYYFENRTMEDIARIIGFANQDVAKSKKYQCKKSLEALLKKRLKEAGVEKI